jgi:hypothetical protein
MLAQSLRALAHRSSHACASRWLPWRREQTDLDDDDMAFKKKQQEEKAAAKAYLEGKGKKK